MVKANTPIPASTSALSHALGKIEKRFRDRICDSYLEAKSRATLAARSPKLLDTVGISAGKFCESVLRLLQHELTGTNIPFGQHIKAFPDEVRKLTTLPAAPNTESQRLVIPRALLFVMTMRNKRAIGHIGGDLDANLVDSAANIATLDWTMCELIRIYYDVPIEEAQDLIITLTERSLPEVWQVAGKKRLLVEGLNFKDQVLVLMYSDPHTGVLLEDVFNWVEYSNFSVFKTKVIGPLHASRQLEWDRETDALYLSPLGQSAAEAALAWVRSGKR